MALVDLDAGAAGDVEQGGVEVGAAGHGGVAALAARQREGDLATRRRPHDDVVDRLPRRDLAGLEAELLEQPEGAGGEAVAAALVAREGGLVEDRDSLPGPGQGDGGGGPGRPTADDGDVDVHGLTLRAASAGRPNPP